MRWATEINVPIPAQLLGAAPVYHCVFFRPIDDVGGLNPTVVFQIPESDYVLIRSRLAGGRYVGYRVVFCCDTPQQAAKAARFGCANLPNHERIALERAQGGGWGGLV